jgi:dolichyl-phosphate-mannose--protein O-mannosyl transferase
LLFFVAVPLTIYLLSYAVHFGDREFTGIGHFLKTVYSTNFGKYNSMLSYHGTPGLGMDHYYYSPWYEWPLMIKPMYYASAAFKPEGMTYAIFCFGNPWVWCVGLAGIAYTIYRWLHGHRYRITGQEGSWQLLRNNWDVCPAFVLIGLLAQFLPWVLVPRGTYIYHYFASVPFLILSTVLLMQQISICSPALGKRLLITHLVLCLVWFVLLFPYASGIMAPNLWMDFIRDYPYISLLPDYWKSDFLVDLNAFLEKVPIFPHVYHH